MGYRVDSVTVTLDCYIEFEGRRPITFVYTPTGADDPLVLQLLKINQEQNMDLARKGPPPDVFGFG
jgi:hypothetical protein